MKCENDRRVGATIANDVREKLDPVVGAIGHSTSRDIPGGGDRRLEDDLVLEIPEHRYHADVQQH